MHNLQQFYTIRVDSITEYFARLWHYRVLREVLTEFSGFHFLLETLSKPRHCVNLKPCLTKLIICNSLLLLGDVACKFRGSLVYICHGASVFTLTYIAHDRYYAICKPLTNHLRRTSMKWIIPQTWLLAILIHIPSIIYCGSQVNKFKQSSCSCYELFPNTGVAVTYAVSRYFIVYVFPVVLVFFRYTAVIRKLHQQTQSERESGFMSQETKKRVVKMLVASTVFFFLAWTPFYTSYLLQDTGVDKGSVYR